MIVDAHVHVWEPPSSRFAWQPLGELRPAVPWSAEEQCAAMEEVGIDRGVLIQTSWYGYNNDYLLDVAQRFPGRFALIGMVDPSAADVDAQIQKLVARGVSGFRLMPRLRTDIDWFNPRLWEAADSMGLVMTLLVSPDQAVAAAETIERSPHVQVVIDHLARPDQEVTPGQPLFRQLLAMARYPNLYLKVSALSAISRQPAPYLDAQQWLQQALAAYGAERLMWGSDSAMSRERCSLSAELAVARQALAEATPGERAWVLGGTAARLWNFASTPERR